jgi:MFS family permease
MTEGEVVLRSVDDVVRFVDQRPNTRKSWFVVAIALGGVFADAYDFASLGVGIEPLKHEFGLTPMGIGGVTAAMAVGAGLGAIFGGWFTDKIGRYRMFTLDLIFLIVAAIGAALSVNLPMLLGFRFFMGISVGLDFPVALSFIAEFVNARSKGGSVNLWQPMWYVAASCTGLSILPFYYLDFGPYLWRIAVGFGAVPALIILLLRARYMDESPVWSAQNLGLEDAARVLRKMYGVTVRVVPMPSIETVREKLNFGVLFSRRFIASTLLATIICMTQSMEYFAVGFNIPSISAQLFGGDYLYAILGAIFFNLFGIVGGTLGVSLTAKLGCRNLAIIGYCLVILSLTGFWLGGGSLSLQAMTCLLCLFIFGHSFGPGPQGMTIATVSYPTEIRGLGSGWGQGMVRVGSIMGFYFFPLVIAAVGLRMTMMWITLAPLCGLLGCLFIRWKPAAAESQGDAKGYVGNTKQA